MSSMLVSTIDCYHFVPLSVALALAEHHKVEYRTCWVHLTQFTTEQDQSSCEVEAVQTEHPDIHLD